MLNEISQMRKDEVSMILLGGGPRLGKFIDTEHKVEVSRASWWGAGHREFMVYTWYIQP